MASNETVKCPTAMKATSNGVFQGDNPLHYALPLVIVQICLVVVLTRVLACLLRPLRQPRVIAEIIGGVLLGPSALGRNKKYLNAVFPAQSLPVLDTLANLGLLFFLFLVGLELDPKALRRTGKTALSIAVGGITLPFALGVGTSFVLRMSICDGVSEGPFLIFMGVALSITAFPVLARILAELKLLTTDVGRIAMAAAAVNDVAAWILLALAVALSGSPIVSLWVFLSALGFITSCILVCPKIFRWMARRCPKGEPVDEIYICATLTAILAAGFVTDTIGIHPLFGAFVVGVLVPKQGAFADALVDKVEDLVSGLFLPLYFVSSGLKTDVATIEGARSWGLLGLVIFTACFGKIFGTIFVSLCCRIPFKQAITLGFLMNTKGLVELIVLNIGRDRGVLNEQTFAIMVLMALFTTFITTPVVMAVYRPPQAATEYRNRTIQRRKEEGGESELRMVVCFHTTANVSTLINLIEASSSARLRVYAMHLMELSERSSAILMIHKARNNGLPFWNNSSGSNSGADQMVVAFQHLGHVCIRPTTAISAMSTMHEDVCSSACRKRAAIVILPFDTHRSDFRLVNKRVLEHAPCSVAILVDRGRMSGNDVNYVVTALFFGGQDDREALAYGALMADRAGITLNVVRFVVDRRTDSIHLDVVDDDDDEEFLLDFKRRVSEGGSIKYEEVVINDGVGDGVVEAIRGYNHCDLFVVGRTPEWQGVKRKSEWPELGPVGNLLISGELKSTASSVLVVQQYRSQLSGDALASLKEETSSTDED